jgi:hypothetical protein
LKIRKVGELFLIQATDSEFVHPYTLIRGIDHHLKAYETIDLNFDRVRYNIDAFDFIDADFKFITDIFREYK